MSMFLDADEVRDLTNRIQRQAQAKMLRSLGITFKVRADGSALVLRSHVEKELGGGAPAAARTREFTPNWGAANA
jgi:hypothetical protein